MLSPDDIAKKYIENRIDVFLQGHSEVCFASLCIAVSRGEFNSRLASMTVPERHGSTEDHFTEVSLDSLDIITARIVILVSFLS